MTRTKMKRRDFLRVTLAVGAAASLPVLRPHRASANKAAAWPAEGFDAETLTDAMKKTIGKSDVPLSPKVKLNVPKTAENGAVVPVTVEVDSPMTAADYIETLYLYVDDNPRPLASEFHFTPASGKAYVQQRLKMGGTSNIRAVAKTNKGQLMAAAQEVRVTIAGCG